jgi:hypothetical protein
MRFSALFGILALFSLSCSDSNPAQLPKRPLDVGSSDSTMITGLGDGGISLPPDGETRPSDAGAMSDAVTLPMDGSSPRVDGGSSMADASPSESDGGSPMADAGLSETDGGSSMADAAEIDARAPAPDVGGNVEPDGQVDMACNADCDGDRVSVEEGDCDDDDADVFPGQVELCDGIDNDCLDGIDNDVSQGCYSGPDGSLGIGRCIGGIQACAAGQFGPCVGEVIPAIEVCGNQLDEDCDGVADENCDQDDDGVTTTQGDCRDDLDTVNPNLPEVCDGLDNDCDDVVDGIDEVCYEGPINTENIGVCRAGSSLCTDGVFGACIGQVTPVDEACDNEIDDDCDGQADEGCQEQACPDLAEAMSIVVSSTCLAAGTEAKTIVRVALVTQAGEALNDADVQLNIQPDATAGPLRQVGNVYYRVVSASAAPAEINVTGSVGCADGSRRALNPPPAIRVVPQEIDGLHTRTGGCTGIDGHVHVRVMDADTGQPIPAPWIQVGNANDGALGSDVDAALRGEMPAAPRVIQGNELGIGSFFDADDRLNGPQNVTVGAPGYENVSLMGINASAMTIALRSNTPPDPQPATTGGRMIDFANLGSDGAADMGLVFRSFDLEFLSTFAFSRLLSRYDCWDPVTQGFAGGLVGNTAVPGNLYVPLQQERIGFLQARIEAHRFILNDLPAGRDNIVALSGKVPVGDVVGLLAGGGSLSGIIQLLSPQEIGVRKNIDLGQARADLDIPLAVRLNQNARCRFRNVPQGTGVFCITAGDWSGGQGTPRYFPMGLATMSPDDAAGGQFKELELTTAPQAGEFQGIGYLGATIALFLDAADAPAGLANAVSAVMDRETLNGAGGVVVTEDFFSTTPVSRNGLGINWNAVGNANSPPVDVCRADIVRVLYSNYNPGACSENLSVTKEVPIWSAFIAGDAAGLVLPSVPRAWPNGNTAGILDPASTPEADNLRIRLTCSGLGQIQNFSLDRTSFERLLTGLTHASSNTVNY